jgi:hypothetical protein
MHDFFAREPDPVERLLGPPELPADGNSLQQELRQRTTRALRHRRRLQNLTLAMTLAACYAAGLLTMRWLMPGTSQPAPLPTQAEVKESPPARIQPSPVALEWQAVDNPGRRAELYRQAGDLYLTVADDPENALRSYGNALDAAAGENLDISPNDNWLFMALKEARKKEKR